MIDTRPSADERDEAMAADYGARANAGKPTTSGALAAALRSLIVSFTDDEFEAAATPWLHAFQSGETGMFPVGEVTVVASAGREGKTTALVGVATALAIGHTLADLEPLPGRAVIIYSAEDDRRQYARKVGAQIGFVPANAAHLVKERLLVPNLDDLPPGLSSSIVQIIEGKPDESAAVETIIAALEPMMKGAHPLGVLVFETASTLSEAGEDNPGFRVLILALRRIARALNVAVVLSHHVSQASLSNLPDLNLSTADIRGATALVNNARQVAMLVNLGSNDDPFPDGDARTILRKMTVPDADERVSALIFLDSSKGITPPPVFFRWVKSERHGPAAVEIDPLPLVLQRKPWRKVREMVMAARAGARAEAKGNSQNASVALVVKLVAQIEGMGKQPTARAVSLAAGKSPGWASPYLEAAVEAGELTYKHEDVPRTKKGAQVFRLIDSSELTT